MIKCSQTEGVTVLDSSGNYVYSSIEDSKGGNIMWAYESVFYQIYPLGFCGAPFENDGIQEHRILKVI